LRTTHLWKAPAIPARRAGWERAYVEVMERHMSAPFAWGVSDCLIVPADLCLAMTGVDPMKRMRRYSSEVGAMKLLLKTGCADVEAALALAFRPVPPAYARRGDCGVFEQTFDGKPWLTTFVIMGDRAVAKGPDGAMFVPIHKLKSTFAIGAR
jgi:hypothetical protein